MIQAEGHRQFQTRVSWRMHPRSPSPGTQEQAPSLGPGL